MIRVQFNAFDRDSSDSYSRNVAVDNLQKLQEVSVEFDKDVPFSRFYRDSEFLSDEIEPDWEKKLKEMDEG